LPRGLTTFTHLVEHTVFLAGCCCLGLGRLPEAMLHEVADGCG
jgi:hypothetical protein